MIKKVVIPVAGMGTRFLPVTKTLPKEMLPIVDVPTIQILLDEAYEAGIEEVLFITSPTKENIINHFDQDYELENRLMANNKTKELEIIRNIKKINKIYSIRQGEPLGTGHAVLLAKEFVKDEPFAVMFGDNLVKGVPALKELVSIYEKTQANIVGVQEVNDVEKYGIVTLNNGIITNIIEKPKKEETNTNLASLGRYIFNKEIFEELENINKSDNGEYQLTDAMIALMKKQQFLPCNFTGTYFDIGTQIGYLKANISYALDREELKEELKEFLKEI